MRYSIDTSVIITAWRDHYWPDIFSGLWARFEAAIEEGTFVAIDEVRRELVKRDDDIAAWAADRKGFFVTLDEDIQLAAADVLLTHPKLVHPGGSRSAADPFVIALGIARGYPVVTYERRSNSVEKPRIPNVCDDKKHRVMNFEDLIREQGWEFGV